MYRISQRWPTIVWDGSQLNSPACQNVASSSVPVNARLPQNIQRSFVQSLPNAIDRKNAVRNTYPAPMNSWVIRGWTSQANFSAIESGKKNIQTAKVAAALAPRTPQAI